MWNRFKDTFGIGSGINLKTTWFQMRNRFKDSLELEAESNWNWNGLKTAWFQMRNRFKDSLELEVESI